MTAQYTHLTDEARALASHKRCGRAGGDMEREYLREDEAAKLLWTAPLTIAPEGRSVHVAAVRGGASRSAGQAASVRRGGLGAKPPERGVAGATRRLEDRRPAIAGGARGGGQGGDIPPQEGRLQPAPPCHSCGSTITLRPWRDSW